MGLFDKILGAIGGPVSDFVGTIFSGIDALSTTEEEKLQLKAAVQQQQNELLLKLTQIEADIVAEQASIIKTEATSESWLTRSWRPITMLAFVALMFLYWFGVQPDNITQETLTEVFGIIKIGVGGYVVSRGAEKFAANWKAPS